MPKHKTKGPLTLQGAALPKQAFRSDVCLTLRVVHRDSAAAGRGISALVHPSSIQQLLSDNPTAADASADAAAAEAAAAAAGGTAPPTPTPVAGSAPSSTTSCFLQLSSGSDCVLHTRPCAEVPPGCIQVDEVQQANLRLCVGEAYSFSVFLPGGQPGTTAAAVEDDSSDTDGDAVMEPADTAAAAAAAAAAAEDAASEQDEDDGCDDEAGVEGGQQQQQQQQQGLVPFELTDIEVEVRLLPGSGSSSSSSSSNSSGPVQVDGVVLTQAFCSQCFGRVLAANEYVIIDLPGTPPLLLRVVGTNTLTAEEQQEALGYHCFRGLLTPDTEVYFTSTPAAQQQPSSTSISQQQEQQGQTAAATAAHQLSSLSLQGQAQHPSAHSIQQQQQQHVQAMNGSGQSMNGAGAMNGDSHHHDQQQQQPVPVQSRVAAHGGGSSSSSSLELLYARQRPPAAAPTNIVHVTTSDGEWFPVKKKLLRPCIALTKAVRDSGNTAPHVTVDIDTLTFDRVLIFLEAAALRRRPPRFAVHLLGDLQEAGAKLGLRSLQEYCRKLLGRKQAALQMYSYADVQRANASGKVWLVLDGMVLDVGRWLPEHPGGASIIPKQSLDCDCARFFEMYHASRESFLYIEEFYIGELLPADRPSVPLGGRQPPSQDFLQQLREFTTWREAMQRQALARSQQASTFKSF